MIRTGDPFGFFEASAGVGQGVTLVVYPRVDALPLWRLPPASVEGAHATPERTLQTTPLVSTVRPYAPGDSMNRIHWPTTARLRRDPGQGVRPRADRRRVAVPRPRRGHRGGRGRAVDDRGRRPGRRLDRRQGARREPCGRHVHQRPPADRPARRPRRAPAPEDPPAARGGRSRRADAARRGPRHRASAACGEG